jgi:hypothetical protein
VSASLEPGEAIRLDARPHWVSIARPVLLSLAAAVAGVVLAVRDDHQALSYAGAGLVLLGSLLAARAIWRREGRRILLTSERLVVRDGILRRRSAAVRLAHVPVELEQSVPGRLLGYGTLVAGDLEVPHVPQARRVRRLLG